MVKKKGNEIVFSIMGLNFTTIGIALIRSTSAGYPFLALGFVFGLIGVVNNLKERKS